MIIEFETWHRNSLHQKRAYSVQVPACMISGLIRFSTQPNFMKKTNVETTMGPILQIHTRGLYRTTCIDARWAHQGAHCMAHNFAELAANNHLSLRGEPKTDAINRYHEYQYNPRQSARTTTPKVPMAISLIRGTSSIVQKLTLGTAACKPRIPGATRSHRGLRRPC
jgi:hypothetical protein